MIEAWGELNVRETFAEAARTFADLVRRIPPNRWDAPGLGEWDLRSLVGHTSRSLITVETYLGQPADTLGTRRRLEHQGPERHQPPAHGGRIGPEDRGDAGIGDFFHR